MAKKTKNKIKHENKTKSKILNISKKENKPKPENKTKLQKQIKLSAIFGIITLIFAFPLGGFELLKFTKQMTSGFMVMYILVYLLFFLFTALFVRGFIITGRELKIPLLIKASFIMIFASALATVFQIILLFAPQITTILSIISLVIISGAATLLFGIALLKLKKKFGSLATAAGVLEIIGGAASITVILALGAILLAIPAMIIEIILLFVIAKKL
ncbi:MAG: hypothetical protein KKF46_04385 [Nanoarchaeota archaeon]|nr:hypothetical protein [Nanoarchaeota archaeon]MBU1321574.1 hypothetical protein [Nanoarchaeota archaeon]MBU1598381.1 hypothetical protein [Nanoarchaeota archaeon]MBU2442130.1 hypothetical protein [Nanoarchaeota archaeon]